MILDFWKFKCKAKLFGRRNGTHQHRLPECLLDYLKRSFCALFLAFVIEKSELSDESQLTVVLRDASLINSKSIGTKILGLNIKCCYYIKRFTEIAICKCI